MDFIKMDIEGAEIKAIQGAENILKEGTNLAIASYHLINGKMSFNRLESLIESFGYKTKTKFSIHLTTYAFK
ncbi:MAG: FkbM family methyltransferase [Candidatus Lokiarchaeota archaeon]